MRRGSTNLYVLLLAGVLVLAALLAAAHSRTSASADAASCDADRARAATEARQLRSDVCFVLFYFLSLLFQRN